MNRATGLLFLMIVTLLAGTAHAQTVNWKYAEGGWALLDPDRGSSENGWFLGGAFDLGKLPLHFFAEISDYGPLEIWQVEEIGLLGSREYVKVRRRTVQHPVLPEHGQCGSPVQ